MGLFLSGGRSNWVLDLRCAMFFEHKAEMPSRKQCVDICYFYKGDNLVAS